MSRFVFVLCVVACTASAAPVYRGQGRLWLGLGGDSNAPRDFVSGDKVTVGDGFLFGLGSFDGAVVWERARLGGSYDFASRKFFALGSEDTLIQNAQLSGAVSLGKYFEAGVSLRGRDRRGAERDYTDAIAEGTLDFVPDARVSVNLRVGAHWFVFWPRPQYGFFGPDATLSARYRFDRRHSLSVFGGYSPRTYAGDLNDRPITEDVNESTLGIRRQDTALNIGVAYSYRGPFQLTASYGYSEQLSNSFGESIQRHRLGVTAGFRLPWELTLLAAGTLQFTRFPDGVYLTEELQIAEDDENSSYVTLKLVRPLTKKLEVDLRYALYVNVLPGGTAFVYTRHVVSLGLSVNF